MEQFLRDVKHTVRSLRRAPVFTLVAVLTIALGIGLNSTIFSLVSAVLFRPLPVESPGELVDVYGISSTSDDHGSNSYLNFLDYQGQSETLSGMIAYTNFFANLSIDGSSELVVGELVSRDYFSVLGVDATAGRTFTEEEFAAEGSSPVAVVSHPFWQTRFGGSPDVAGRTFRLNGLTYTVVGVAPQGFGGMFPAATAQLWIPVTMTAQVEPLGARRSSGGPGGTFLERRGLHYLWVKGRRSDGVSVPQVQAELDAITARLADQYPDSNEGQTVRVVATNDVAISPDLDRTIAPAGYVLLGAVALVLLVACANLANMMLARSASRRAEYALRHTLGAGRNRLIRYTLAESLLVALGGGVLAVGLAYGLTGWLARFQPPLPIDLGLNVSPDWRVLVFTLGVAVAAGVAFGIVPAVRGSRLDLVPALRGESSSERRRWWSLRNALVVAQVAVSMVVLVAGALLVRSLDVSGGVEMGYEPDRLAHLSLAMEMNGYDGVRAGQFFAEGKRRLEALPEVERVGITSRLPLSLNNNRMGVYIDGHQASSDDRPYAIDGARIDENYLDALDLRVVSGRGIEMTDREESARVAVITRATAERYWPGQDAVGREFRTTWSGEPYRIVGVVEDYKVNTPGEEPTPYIHTPLRTATTYGEYVVRTAGPAGPLVRSLEAELRTLEPELVFVATGTLRKLTDVRLFPIRAGAWLIGAFGVLALILAAVGLYGVVAYSVNRRLKEIGIRKALGAERNSVIAMILRQGLTLVAVGAVTGLALAAIGTRSLSSVLFVAPLDIPSFGAALAVLVVVALFANWFPARRAARVDPMQVVREA